MENEHAKIVNSHNKNRKDLKTPTYTEKEGIVGTSYYKKETQKPLL